MACGKLSLWNMRTFKRVHSFSLEADVRTESLAFSRDGRLMLAACSDGRARLFDSASRAEVRPPACSATSADLALCTPHGSLKDTSAHARPTDASSATPGLCGSIGCRLDELSIAAAVGNETDGGCSSKVLPTRLCAAGAILGSREGGRGCLHIPGQGRQERDDTDLCWHPAMVGHCPGEGMAPKEENCCITACMKCLAQLL